MTDFSINVFVNCPFDNEYFPILKAKLFSIVYLGFNPKISETTDSGSNRLTKILKLIKESKYSIHDISRIELNDKMLPRFNMPLECGIDFGVKLNGNKRLKTKSFLILEKEQYRYQQFMSDIAGNDIRHHNNDPQKVIKHVRDWLKLNTNGNLAFANDIWSVYCEFLADFHRVGEKENFDPNNISEITFSDLIEIIRVWLEGWRNRPKL